MIVDLVAMYEAGGTGDQVGLDFGVSRWAVHKLFVSVGVWCDRGRRLWGRGP